MLIDVINTELLVIQRTCQSVRSAEAFYVICGTYFLLIWYKNNWRLTMTMPSNKARDASFLNCAWSRSSIRRSADARQFVMPRVLLCTSIVKVPALFDEMMMSILSNCRGENGSIDNKIPFSYNAFALYLKEPNCGVVPDFCRSRMWKYCLVKGRVRRFLLLRHQWR